MKKMIVMVQSCNNNNVYKILQYDICDGKNRDWVTLRYLFVMVKVVLSSKNNCDDNDYNNGYL